MLYRPSSASYTVWVRSGIRPWLSTALASSIKRPFALSDDFSKNRFGLQWNFHKPQANEALRVRYDSGALVIAGKGTSPSDSSPLACVAGDHAYEISVDVELGGAAEGGLLLYFNERLYVGLAHNGTRMCWM